MSDLAAAVQVAIRVHAGQTDKQGEPYLLHVLRVMRAVSDEAKVLAALHDVVEDGGPGVNALQAECALSDRESYALVLLSRSKDQVYGDYIVDFTVELYGSDVDALAREVKLADLRDNLGRIPTEPPLASSYPKDEFGSVEEVLNVWLERWKPLKARYEKAIATLESESVTVHWSTA